MRADELQTLNRLCDEFESDVKANRRPLIEEFLGRCPPSGRTELFRELLVLDLSYRTDGGEVPTVDGYLLQFSEYAEIVRAVFEELKSGECDPPFGSTDHHGQKTLRDSSRRPASAPAPGTNRFRRLRPHAQGGLGEVFVAEDLELHRKVALKQIRSQFTDDVENRTRFILEAEITGSLEHPGIVPVYGFGIDEHGRPYYAMRFIHGQSLRDAIQHFHATAQKENLRWLEFRRLLRRFIDVCNAIEYAHSRGVLHRDLKPANIMLGRFGETLVVDWGLAKPLDREEAPVEDSVMRPMASKLNSETTPTQMGTVVGTPAYMSPEQAAGKVNELTPASDIYSLGAMLFHLLTGRPPLTDDDMSLILERVQHGDVPRPRQVNPQAPKALEAICLKAMSPSPADRYDSAVAMADDIEKWLADEPVAAYAEPWQVSAGRWARRHASFVSSLSVATVLIVIASVLAFVVNQRAKQKLLNAVETDQRLVLNEIRANRFRAAESILDKTVQQLRDEQTQPALLAKVEQQRQRVHRLIEFDRLADQAWFLAGEDRDQETIDSCTAAFKTLGVRDEPQWWRRIEQQYSLTAAQQERFTREVHRLLLLQASVITKKTVLDLTAPDAKERCEQVLALLKWAEAYEPSAYTRLLENFCHFRMGNVDKIKPVSTLEPTSAADYFFFGFIYLWVANFPDNASSTFVKQMVRQIAGMEFEDELPKAQAYFRRAAELEPERYWHHFMIALAQFTAQDYAGAELALNTCIALRPDSVWAYLVRADMMSMHASRTNDDSLRKRAEEIFERLINMDPDFPSVYFSRGTHFTTVNRIDEALDDFAKYLMLEPLALPSDTMVRQIDTYVQNLESQQLGDPANRQFVKALAALKLGHNDQALASAATLIDDPNRRPMALAIRGFAKARSNDESAAQTEFEQALAADPKCFLASLGLARLAELQNQPDQALCRFDRALENARVNWEKHEAHSGRARALTKLKRLEDAKAAQNDADRFATDVGFQW